MAYNLETVFTVRDNASNKIKQMTKAVEKLDSAMAQLSTRFNQTYSDLNRLNSGFNNVTKSVKLLQTTINQLNGGINQLNGGVNNNTKIINHNTTVINNNTHSVANHSNTINNNSSTVNNNTSTINRNTNVRNTWISTVNNEANAIKGLGASLISLAGLYAAAQAGQKAFQSTIGAAAKYEQNELALAGMFQDADKAKKYLQLVEQMAIESPVLSSGEMADNSKAFVGMTKDLTQLEKAWKLVERVQAYTGVDTRQATFSTKELLQGDYVSMYEITGFDKETLKSITKMGDIEKQMVALDELMSGMGINDAMIEGMGNTTLGQWASINELIDSFLRKVGMAGNTKLSATLKSVNEELSKLLNDGVATKVGDALGTVVDKAIDVGKWMWKWREPLAWAAGALAAVASAFVGMGIIAALASPISLIAAGIAGAAVGMKWLYDNSESFRGAIDGIIGKAKELWAVFKDGGVNGVIAELFPPNIASTIQGVITQIQALWGAFKSGGVGGVVDMIFGEGTFESLVTKFNEVKTFIVEKIAELQPTFETLKSIFSTVWNTISSVFTTVWTGVLQPGLANLWDALQILGNVAVIVFNNVIVPALQFAATLFSVLWSVAGPILSLLGAALRTAFAVLKWVWDTILTPLVAFITGGVKNAFEAFTDAVNVVGGAFDWVGGIIDTIAGKVEDFIDTITSFKLPDWVTNGVNATVKFVGGAIDKVDAAINGTHYNGLGRVPYNG